MTLKARNHNLTDHQIVILMHAANGMTGAEIAYKTGMTVSAVADTVRRARVALRAANTVHAVALAVAMGHIRPEDLSDLDGQWREEQ